MEFKKSMIIIMLAIFIASIAGVCASDADDALLASEDASPVEVAQTDAVSEIDDGRAIGQSNDEGIMSEVNAGTFSQLQDNITAKYGGTLELDRNYENVDGFDTDGIKIEQSITIDGKGHAIDAKGKSRVFNVQASDVTIKNLTIKNANYNGDGGAIYFNQSGSLINCNFASNNASSDGGAVYFNKLGSLTDCNFTANSAINGGAIFISNMGYGNVTGCCFANNSAFNGGAVNMYLGIIENCNFANNNATNVGGAVVFCEKSSLKGCNFTNNTASNYGGAVSMFDGNVENCNFINDKIAGDDGCGGAVYTNFGTFENCNFTNNSATLNGGAVYFDGSGTVTNCNLAGNSAVLGGALFFFKENATVEDCNFTANSALNGGAVYTSTMCYGNVTGCCFANNSAFNGGAVSMYAGSIEDCNFAGNNATNVGGAVKFSEKGSLKGCNFTNNTASAKGGAVSMFDGDVVNCNFINDKVAGDEGCGGAVYTSYGTFENCNFTNNSATLRGGAVYFDRSGTVTNCNLAGNSARLGGAVYFKENATVENCNFTANSAHNGGAISTSTMCYGNVTGCCFANNSAFNGGAVNMYTGIIEDCNFAGNNATNAGGAVIFSEGGRFADCNFAGNTAFEGGAVSMFTGNIQNCNFTGNNATIGSAINFNGFSGTIISNSSFLNNRANASADNPLNVTVNGNAIEITFMGQNNLLNAIYSNGDVNFTNVTYWGAVGIDNTGVDSVVLSCSNCEAGQNISVNGVVNGIVLKTTEVTDFNGKVVLENVNDYYLILRHDGDSYYTEVERTISNMEVNVTSQTATNRKVNITAKSNIPQDVVQGKLVFILPNGTQINATYASDGIWWAVHTFDGYTDYQVNASYSGLDDVTVRNATISIAKANSTVNVGDVVLDYGQSTNVTVTAEGAIGITAKINDNPVTVINNYTIPISGLDVGTYTLTVTTVPDADHNEATATANITVAKANPEIRINVTLEGDTAVIDIFAPEDVTMPALVDVDGVGYYVVITGGKGQLSIYGLAGGLHDVTAKYLGDDRYNQSEPQSESFEVCNVSSAVSVKVDNITYGDKAVIEVTVPVDATGNVTVTIGEKPYSENVSSSKAILIVAGLGVGKYTVDVTYNGNKKYASSDSSTKFEVGLIKIDKKDIFVVDEGNGTVIIVVFKNATGNITVNIGNKTYNSSLVDGNAVITLDDETPGEHEVNVTYWGDGNHEGNSIVSNITVPKYDSPMSVGAPGIECGEPAVIGVTLPDNATGYVFIEIDGVRYGGEELHDGVAVFTIENLTAGVKTIFVDYTGDDNYVSNHTTANITVTKANPEIRINVTLKGDTAFIDVTAPEDVTNPVLVDVDLAKYYVNVTGGKGQLVLPGLAGGGHEVVAIYAGDEGYNSSKSQSESFEIYNIPSGVSVKADNITYGDKAVIEVTVPVDATGNVTVTIGEKSYFENVSSAKAVLIVPGLGAGNYTVNVTYNGDGKYASNGNSTQLEVSKAQTFIKVIDNGNGTVVVVLSDNVRSNVTVKSGNNVYGAAVEDAIAVIDLVNETFGAHDIEVICAGDENHTAAYANASITVDNKLETQITANAVTTTYNVNKDLVISLKDVKGNPISGAKITVDLNGVKTYATDGSGNVKVSTKGLAPNTYTAAITFSGNDNYEKSMGFVKVTVKKATPKLTAKKKTFKAKTKTKKYTITLKDNTGKAIKKAKVTLKVKGKTYKATTNSKGKAVFKIKNLKKKGKYTAVIKFKGNKNYNKVTKKVKLTVKSSKKKKSTFKTLSKGSKDKATIKKIQRALKNKGYYLTYKGQYLKIDGIYHGHTERSVKEFQHDKGLKVTGKVDEKTAKKLGII